MAKKIKYSEPADYFPKNIRDKFDKASNSGTKKKDTPKKETPKKKSGK